MLKNTLVYLFNENICLQEIFYQHLLMEYIVLRIKVSLYLFIDTSDLYA